LPTSGYIRFPAIAGDAIVFTAEDDLWRVSVSGGRAERLTAGTATASYARFSPDGSTLAFVGREEGPDEVFVMPAEGGPAQRATYQGAPRVRVAGWRPDGSEIVFASDAGQFSPRKSILFAVKPSGGEPQPLPYGVANAIAYGPGNTLVLGRNTHEAAFWKRYHGGTAGHFWIDHTGNGAFQRFLDLSGDLASPCFVGQRFYFTSDHEGLVPRCAVGCRGLRHRSHYRSGLYAARLRARNRSAPRPRDRRSAAASGGAPLDATHSRTATAACPVDAPLTGAASHR
jgi:tricorn protease